MTSGMGYNLTTSDGSSRQNQVGGTIELNGATWIYVLASTAVTQYNAVIVTNTMTVAPLTTTLATATQPQVIGIAQYAFASGDYGWVPVGPFYLREDDTTTFKVINGNTPSAANVKLYSHATAGAVSDQTAASAVLIPGLLFPATATTAGTAYAVQATRRLTVNNA